MASADGAAEPAAKHPREEADEPEKHLGLWFDDGNIILRAEIVLFRVHRSMLSRHSKVFEDLFSVAHSSEDEQLDGVPVITVQDCPLDLGDFLDVIYSGAR